MCRPPRSRRSSAVGIVPHAHACASIMSNCRISGPMHDRQSAVEILDQGGAAFHPVAVVAVEDAVDVADLGLVDVPAHHAIGAAAPGLRRHRVLELAHIADRVLDLVLEEGGERPVRIAEPQPRLVEPVIEDEGGAIGAIAQEGEPVRVAHHAVEIVAVDDQQRACRWRWRAWSRPPHARRRDACRDSRAASRRGCRARR